MSRGIKTLGNHGLAYLLTKGNALSGSTAKAAKGNWYYVAEKDDASVLPVRVGLPFLAKTELDLEADDKIVPLTPLLLGFARGKSLGHTKNVVDATTDSDAGVAQNLTDGVVTASGSISGYNEIPAAGSAQEIIMQQFQAIARQSDDDGTVEVKELESETLLLMIDWTARRKKASGPAEGDVCEIDITPAIFTSKNTDSDYGSPKGFNVDYTATSRDDDGFEPIHWVGKYYLPVAAE